MGIGGYAHGTTSISVVANARGWDVRLKHGGFIGVYVSDTGWAMHSIEYICAFG